MLIKSVSQLEFDHDGDTVPELVGIADTLRITCVTSGEGSDIDSDGCTDTAELGANPATGGQRWPFDYWDFYDAPDLNNARDKAITIANIFAVGAQFGHTCA